MGDEEAPSGSIEDRINHKNWKWRVSGLEELTTKFKNSIEGSGPLFNEWGPQFKKILADINPMSQEKALEPLLAFIDRCDCVNKFAASYVGVLVEKLFASTRPRAKEKTIECLLLTIEADSAEPVVEALLKGTSSTSPKILLASLTALTQALKTFGPKQIPVKLILKQFSPWFENRDKGIRDQASELFIELYRWIGKALIPLISEALTPIQLKALQDQFEKLPSEPAVPLKYTRSEAAKAMANAAKGIQSKPEVVEEIDPYSLMTAVNILPKLTSEFYEGLQAKKWQERSEQMDKLVTLLTNTPKIESADFSELCKALKKILADVNVIIVQKAVVSIGLMADSLRGGFTGYVKPFITPILEKFKEKKTSVLQSVHTTMDSLVAKSISLPDIIDELTAIMQSKVPQIKQEVLIFICNSITNTKKPADITKVTKQLTKIFMEALNDTDSNIRDNASKAFAALGGIIGERAMTPYLNQIDPIKAKKIKDNMPAVATPVVVTPQPMAPVDLKDIDLPVSKKPPTTAGGSSASTGSKPTTASSSSSTPTGRSSNSSPLPPTSSTDDIKNKLIGAGIVNNEIIEGLGKTQWKDRLQAVDDILENVKGLTSDSMNGMSEPIIQLLCDKPGLKESNFQVLSSIFSIFIQCCKNDSNFTQQRCANSYLTTCIEKLTDVKLKEISSELLFSTSESITPHSVFTCIYQFATNHKNPKIISDSLVWIQQAIDEFGIGCCSNGIQQLKPLLDYTKQCLENTNPDVKKSAIKLLCTIRMNIGATITDFLGDVKKPTMEVLDKEFQKVRDQKPPAPNRQWKGMPPPGSAPVQIEFPRVDISVKITPNIITNLSDANWKTRSDALDEIERIIIDANRKIQPKLGGLVPALKNRLTDNNQKCTVTTLNIIGMLSQSMGPSFEKNARLLIPGILLLLGDSKKPVRDAVISCMNVIQSDLGFDVFIGSLAAPMIQESAFTRKESLAWTITNVGNMKAAPVASEMNTLAKGIISCLQDKSAEIRSLADNLLSILCTQIPAIEFKKELKHVKPVSQPSIQAILDKYYQKGGQPIPPPTKSTSKSPNSQQQSSTPSSPQPVRQPTQQPQQSQQPQPQQQQQPQQRRSILPSNNGASNNCEFIIFDINGKINRQKTNQIPSWHFIEPTEEVIEILQDQVLQCFTEEFANLMFSSLPSNSQHMADLMIGMIEQNPEAIISVLDIVFRWITFKLFDTGLASQKRVLKILEILLNKLIESEYSIGEYEASCLVPILLEKSGSATNEQIKQIFKQSIQQLEELCLPNVLFRFAIEMVSSQNWRTRVEVLNVMASIIDKNGASVCGNLKVVIPLITQNLNDSQSKQSSLLCLNKLYSHIKDECFKYSNISQQDKLLISGNNNINNNNIQQQSQQQSQQQQQQQQPRKSLSTDEMSTQLIGCLELLKNYSITKENVEHTVEALKQFSGLMANGKLDDVFVNFAEEYFLVLTSILADTFPQVSRDAAILRLCKYLIHTIISILSNKVVAKQCNVRCLEIVLNETIKLYSLAESNSSKQGTESELSKAFNQILLRILQNCNSTILFSTLLQMMSRSENDQSIQHPSKYNDLLLRCLLRATKSLTTPSVLEELNVDTVLSEINSFLKSNPSLDEITRKTTKTLTSELYQNRTTQVVKFTKDIVAKGQQQKYQYLLNLLIELVPKQFEDLINGGRISSGGNNNNNTNNSGGRVSSGGNNNNNNSNHNSNNNNNGRDNINNININSNLDSPINDHNSNNTTNTTSRPRTSTTGSSNSQLLPTTTTSTTTTTATGKTQSTLSTLKVNKEPRDYSGKTDSQKKDLLIEIFKKIGNKDLTLDGIHDLYFFIKEYPDYDISPNLNSSSQQFQAYITRNLKKIKDSMEAPKDKDDEIVNYQERLKIIQNTFYNQHNPSSQVVNNNTNNTNTNNGGGHENLAPQLSNTASMASNTLQRLRTLNPDQNNGSNNNSHQNSPSTGSSNDLNSTVASLRQRLAQLTSKSNE
ncbi:hypothetical protein ACTFIV_001038 [Dictyostelium citrinum]